MIAWLIKRFSKSDPIAQQRRELIALRDQLITQCAKLPMGDAYMRAWLNWQAVDRAIAKLDKGHPVACGYGPQSCKGGSNGKGAVCISLEGEP